MCIVLHSCSRHPGRLLAKEATSSDVSRPPSRSLEVDDLLRSPMRSLSLSALELSAIRIAGLPIQSRLEVATSPIRFVQSCTIKQAAGLVGLFGKLPALGMSWQATMLDGVPVMLVSTTCRKKILQELAHVALMHPLQCWACRGIRSRPRLCMKLQASPAPAGMS